MVDAVFKSGAWRAAQCEVPFEEITVGSWGGSIVRGWKRGEFGGFADCTALLFMILVIIV